MNDKPYYKPFEDKKFIARATREPYIGNGMAAVSVAINHSYKSVDGTWKNVDPQFEEVVVFDDDNFNFLQYNVNKGTMLEVSGRVSYKERTGKDGVARVNKSIVVNTENEDHYIKLAAPLEGKLGGPAKQPARKPTRAVKEYDSDVPF